MVVNRCPSRMNSSFMAGKRRAERHRKQARSSAYFVHEILIRHPQARRSSSPFSLAAIPDVPDRSLLAPDHTRRDLVPKPSPGFERRLRRLHGLGPESLVAPTQPPYEQCSLRTVLLRVLSYVPIQLVAQGRP